MFITQEDLNNLLNQTQDLFNDEDRTNGVRAAAGTFRTTLQEAAAGTGGHENIMAAAEALIHASVAELLNDDGTEESTEQWSTVVYNDDDHTFGEVAAILYEQVGLPVEEAVNLTERIDHNGREVVFTSDYDDAHDMLEELYAAGLRTGLEKKD